MNEIISLVALIFHVLLKRPSRIILLAVLAYLSICVFGISSLFCSIRNYIWPTINYWATHLSEPLPLALVSYLLLLLGTALLFKEIIFQCRIKLQQLKQSGFSRN